MLELKDYCNLFNDALKRNEVILMSCRCKVKYSGRAESFLDLGDRILIVKEDKTILIHQPLGNNAINYMKQNSSHSMNVSGKKIVLKSENLELKEFMEVEIDRIFFFDSRRLEDNQEIVIAGTEEDMSKMIYENPSLVEEGLKPVSQEEQTKYGFIDVFCTDKNGNLVIIECKRYCADLGAVTQLRRYVEKIMQSKGVEKVRGILVAPKITSNAEQMLKDWGFSFKSVTPPKYHENFDKKQTKLLDGWR